MKSHRAQAREQAAADQAVVADHSGHAAEFAKIKTNLRALVARSKKSEAKIRKLEADVAALRRGDS